MVDAVPFDMRITQRDMKAKGPEMYNPSLSIIAFNAYLTNCHRECLEKNIPVCSLSNRSSILLKKIG